MAVTRQPRWAALPAMVGVCLVLVGGAATVNAQAKVDFFQGPLVSSGRVTGLGGAYVGIAEGADGHLRNPAAFATRYRYTADDWFDWDFTLNWLNNTAKDYTKLDTSGQDAPLDSTHFLEAGVALKLGRHGFGLQFTDQTYVLQTGSAGEAFAAQALSYRQSYGGLGYGYAFLDGDLSVGAMLLTTEADFLLDEESIAGIAGGSVSVGGLYGRCGSPWRVGAAYRTRARAIQDDGSRDPALIGETLPSELVLPWEFAVGASYMIGQRTYNVCPTYGDEEDVPVRRLARRYLLTAFDLVVTGPAGKGAIGTLAFLNREEQASGRREVYSPRVGLESELWPDELAVRGGTYFEPSRYEDRIGRQHFTAGLDYHVRLYWDWKLGAVADVAHRYVNIGLGLGFWH